MEELIKNSAIVLALLGFIVYLIRLLLSNQVIEDYNKKDNFLNMIYLSCQGIDDLEKDTSCISIGLSCSMLALVFFIAGIILKAYNENAMGNFLFSLSLLAFVISFILYMIYLKSKKYIILFIILSIINICLYIILIIYPDLYTMFITNPDLYTMLTVDIGLFTMSIIVKNPFISVNGNIAMNKSTTTIYIYITILLFILFILYRERYIEDCIQNLKDKNINLKLFFGEQSFEINTGNIDIKHNYIRILDNDNYVTLKLEDISKIEVIS